MLASRDEAARRGDRTGLRTAEGIERIRKAGHQPCVDHDAAEPMHRVGTADGSRVSKPVRRARLVEPAACARSSP
ncbi:MAG: hypothetical protein JOY71_01485 [Acetobacteraceae bacterium]|nr:hypothetical protein [Acetobacteraceae bacterium]